MIHPSPLFVTVFLAMHLVKHWQENSRRRARFWILNLIFRSPFFRLHIVASVASICKHSKLALNWLTDGIW